jgi:anti-sigma B factor antagonist
MNSSNMPSALTIDIDPTGVLVVHGDIDIAGGPILDATLADREPEQAVTLDLADVSFVDSSGLRSLLNASRRAGQRDERVTLRAPRPEVIRLLEITGTTALFDIEPQP